MTAPHRNRQTHLTVESHTLREAGDSNAVTTLLARDPASHASLDNHEAVASLLRELRAAGDGNAVHALATRAASHASLDNPRAIASLLRAVTALAI